MRPPYLPRSTFGLHRARSPRARSEAAGWTIAALVAVASLPAARLAAGRRLSAANRLRFPTFVHPSAICDPRDVELGLGNVVTAGCVFTVDIARRSATTEKQNTHQS